MSHIIAATLGIDAADMSDYRYQPSRTSRAIYAIGQEYFCVGKVAPKNDGWDWQKFADQFWAAKKNTVMWVAYVKNITNLSKVQEPK